MPTGMAGEEGVKRIRARRPWPKSGLWLGAALLLLAGGIVFLRQALSFDAPEEFWLQKGELTATEVEPAGSDSLYEAFDITLVSSAGYRVRGHLRVPRREGRWPALIILGGVRTGRMAAELITPYSPYIILGLDYPWDGPVRLTTWQFLVRVFAIRRAMFLTPSAVFLAIDYLETLPEVDSSPVVLAGASFGAQLVTVAGALDKRAGPVLVIYGGGDWTALLRANLKVKPDWLRSRLASAGAWLLEPVEPLQYAGQVAPRPIIFINGLEDKRIPRHCVEALYEAAGEPKRMIWLEEGHISSRNPELIERVLQAAARALSPEPSESREAG